MFDSYQLSNRDAPRRTRRIDAEVRVCSLVASPYCSVSAHERSRARVEALRARNSARRQSPARIRLDRRKAQAPRERVEQVRSVGGPKPRKSIVAKAQELNV